MTGSDAFNVLMLLRAGLPNAYLKLTEADTDAMVALWAEMFQNYPADLVMAAAKTYIWQDTTGRFPSPGTIRQYMDDIRKVVRQCAYGSTLREYCGSDADRYPAAVQAYIDQQARMEYERSTGRIFTTQAEKLAAARQQGITDGRRTS